MTRYLFVFILLVIVQSYCIAQTNVVFDSLSAKEITEIDFCNYTIKDYEVAFIISKNILKDKTAQGNKMKGAILQSVLANQIELDIVNKKFRSTNPELQKLILQFETEKYYIYRPKMSRFIKLMGYTCRGNYEHIYNRYRDSVFFVPSIVFSVFFFGFFFLSTTSTINFKYRALLNKLVITGFIIIVFIIFIFKQTCISQIQEYSFYSFPL